MICISMLSYFSLLVRNVITHSLCVVCVWILWWSRALCLWEQMIRWMILESLMLEAAGTQCSNRMWHWDMDFCNICIMFWTCYFMLFRSLTCFLFKKKWMTLFWARADVAPCGACRPWIFFINGVLCFLNFNGNGMEKKKSWEEMPLQGEDKSRRSLPP